jgi:hypothetical protein
LPLRRIMNCWMACLPALPRIAWLRAYRSMLSRLSALGCFKRR